jgi:protocatechuate 3,4-dioxygenase beta subunit
VVVAALAAAPGGGAVLAFSEQELEGGGAPPPSRITIVPPGETGTPLVFSGTVYRPDGTTPAPGVVLYVYQTDATGIYGPLGQAPRLRGWLRTDADGGYEVRTIRPGSYPSGGIAAHVHTQLWGGGAATQWNRDLLFAGDPDLSQREVRESATAGRFSSICSPRRETDGTLRCTLDLRLKPVPDRLEPGIRHGLDDAPAWARP